jgi:DNA polymerase I-like protein with 3'-5' exonuclease and polymerase domains
MTTLNGNVATQPPFLLGVGHLHTLATAMTVAFDTETTGLQPEEGGLRLLQLGARDCPIVLIDCWELDLAGWDAVRDFFEAKQRFWLAHNAVFDLGWLQEHGISPNGRVMCSMLASKLISNGVPNLKHGLAAVVERYLGRELSKELQKSDWSAPVLSAEQLSYAADDVQALIDLDLVLTERLGAARLMKAHSLECKALPAMAQMWRTGLPFNRTKLEELQASLEADISRYGAQFVTDLDAALPEEHKLPRDEDGSFNLRSKAEGAVRLGTKRQAGFNLNSPKQLVEKFTVLLGVVPVGKEGKPSAARDALRDYAADHKVIQIYLLWKRAEKRRQMVISLLEHQAPDGYIRASYMQLGAESGRMSCAKPNLQQVPRDNAFRAAAEAPEGWTFVCADFGQMELRLAAAQAEDETMIEAFKNDMDLHTLTASAIYTEPTEDEKELKLRRQVAKSANFGLLFGAGAKGLRNYAGAMGITMTIEEAEEVRDTFHSTYKGINKWQRDNAITSDSTRGDKWAEVRIPVSGMRRFLPGDMNRVTVRCNTPVQGAGAAVMKSALGKLWPLLAEAGEDAARLSAVVHDECLCLVREGTEAHWMAALQRVMEDAEAEWLGDIPPLAEANSGKTWFDAK